VNGAKRATAATSTAAGSCARSFFVIIISPGALNAANTHTRCGANKSARRTHFSHNDQKRALITRYLMCSRRARREQEILRTMRRPHYLGARSLVRPTDEERQRSRVNPAGSKFDESAPKSLIHPAATEHTHSADSARTQVEVCLTHSERGARTIMKWPILFSSPQTTPAAAYLLSPLSRSLSLSVSLLLFVSSRCGEAGDEMRRCEARGRPLNPRFKSFTNLILQKSRFRSQTAASSRDSFEPKHLM
jgi:hypothetical protein